MFKYENGIKKCVYTEQLGYRTEKNYIFPYRAEFRLLDNIAENDNALKPFLHAYPIEYGINIPNKKTKTETFGDAEVNTVIDYTYNTNLLLSQESTTESNTAFIKTDNYLYPTEFAQGAATWIDNMVTANIVDKPIEKYTLRNDKVSQANLITYKTGIDLGLTDKTYKIESADPLVFNSTFYPSNNNNSFTKSTYYKLKSTYDLYSTGNILQYHKENDENLSYLWGYTNTVPVAKIENAKYSDVYYDSFEGSGTTDLTNSKTGIYIYTTNLSYTKNGITSGNYVLSYWRRTGGIWALVSNIITVMGSSYTIDITASTSTPIDEVRFYPADAQMTTYTYDPLIGVSSITDPRNQTTYYIYDLFGRLSLIKDQNGDILKKYDYHYAPN